MSELPTLDDNNIQILGYHNHNFFCDGQEPIEEYVQFAVNQGIKAIGFSSHAPFFFQNKWSIEEDNLGNYIEIIEGLTEKYKNQIQIFKSLEIDYLPNQIAPISYFKKKYQLQYTIGSIHYIQHPKTQQLLFIDGTADAFNHNLQEVFSGDIRLAVESYFAQTKEMILTESPDIIGHIDKISMNAAKHIVINGQYPVWYVNQVLMVINAAAAKGSIVELNLRGLIKGKWPTTFIDERFLKYCHQNGVKMVISTDAHHPSEVKLFYNYGLNLLLKAGFTTLYEYTTQGWKPYNIVN